MIRFQAGRYGNVLQAASEGGHEAVVRLLLKKGAKVNPQGSRCRPPLREATKLLCNCCLRKVLKSMQGGLYGKALQAAS